MMLVVYTIQAQVLSLLQAVQEKGASCFAHESLTPLCTSAEVRGVSKALQNL